MTAMFTLQSARMSEVDTTVFLQIDKDTVTSWWVLTSCILGLIVTEIIIYRLLELYYFAG